ncbi:MAG: discoidin domain-containing protein [Clostridia bacterium]|nr:discoidin domain-containing protein [Clostridia bacterium]
MNNRYISISVVLALLLTVCVGVLSSMMTVFADEIATNETEIYLADGTQEFLSLNVGSDETMRNVVWRYPSVNGKVEYAVKNGSTFPSNFTSVKTVATACDTTYIHRATMTNLAPDTEYVYRIVNDSVVSKNYYFTTDPTDSFNFIFIGDPQIGASGNATTDGTNWCNTVSVANTMFPNTSLMVSAGDQVDNATSKTQYTQFMSSSLLPSYAFAPTIGNHDGGTAEYGGKSDFSKYFHVPNNTVNGNIMGETPAGGDYWYTYNNTLFIHINDNNLSGAEHQAFIKAAFEANPDMRWNILVMHKSLFSGGGNYVKDPLVQAREIFVPIITQFDFDVVLGGHDHVFSRSYMITDGYTPNPSSAKSVNNPEGILYMTGGSSSASKYYGLLSDADSPHVAAKEKNTMTFANVEITDTSFKITTYRTNDKSVVDEFEITKGVSDEDNGNVALKKPYTTSGIHTVDGVATYPDENGKSLTDGNVASADAKYDDVSYTGFNQHSEEYRENGYASITVDLGETYQLNKFTAHVATQLQGAGIKAPKSVEFYVSDDNATWKQVGSVTPNDSNESKTTDATLLLEKAVSGRYIQYRFIGGESNWIMVSEVEAFEYIRENLAFDKEYTANGIHTVDGVPSYPDENGITLTDGVIAPADAKYSNPEYVGFNIAHDYYKANGYFSVEVDLGDSYYLDEFVAYVATVYNTSGILAPTLMEVYVSDDNSNWNFAGSVVPVDDDSQSCVPATVTLENSVKGRYVQYRFTPAKSWVMLAEVEVYEGEPYEAPEEPDKPDVMLGDVNDDKKVDSVDYLLVKRACFKTYTLNEEETLRADVNCDSKIDSTDYLLVKRIAFGTYTVQ